MNDKFLRKLSEIFEISLIEVVEKVAGVRIERAACPVGAVNSFAGILQFSGETNGLFILKTNEGSLRKLTSYMTGTDEKDVEHDDMTDCIGELANMVCGLARARAAAAHIGFSLSTPFSSFAESGIESYFKENAQTFASCFTNQNFYVNVRVCLV